MDTSQRIIRTVIVVSLLVAAVVFLYPKAKESLAPTPLAAHVAIEAEGSDAAVVGPVEMAAGTPFTLYAVLEARSRDGETVYYTEAPALEIDGSRVPADALRRWDRTQRVKVFWFTVEGPAPFIKLEDAAQLDQFRLTEFFRPEWPSAWTIPGKLGARFGEALDHEAPGREARSFGTQRYQVRIELYEHEDEVTPAERFISAGAKALPDRPDELSTVYAALPGPAAPASLAFGLTEIQPPPSPDRTLLARLAGLTRRHLAFSRLALVHDILEAAGETPDTLVWHSVDLQEGPAWGGGPQDAATGDLLRAGARIVVLYQDRGTAGRLDRQDLCFDYERGASVRPLADVFTGEGLVEHARLSPAS